MRDKDLVREVDRWFASEFQDCIYEEHEVCWDVRQRGEVGETILHLCYLNNTEVHQAIAEHLLALYPKLALDIYEGFEYYGESCLHIAIVNHDLDSVKTLCKCGAKLDQRATGRFFRPSKNLTDGVTDKDEEMDCRGQAYFGEFPLAFAASLGDKAIYDFLIEESVRVDRRGEMVIKGRVNPDDQDSYGNTVLHMVVINNQKEMLIHVVRHSIMPASIVLRNNNGLTPLELSFRLGRCALFDTLLDLGSQKQWTYGPLSYVAYPLPGLDSIGPNGRLDENSALMTIVRCGQAQHLKMLEVQIIHFLLQEKWQRYARQRLIMKFAITVIQLLAMCIVSFARKRITPGDEDRATEKKFFSGQHFEKITLTPLVIARYIAEAVVIFICILRMGESAIEVNSRKSFRSYAKTLIELPEKGFMIIATILFLFCIPLRFLGYKWEEDALIIIASPLSWMYLLYFYRANQSLGPLVVMFGRMCIGDIAKFSILYSTFVVMFAAVFNIAVDSDSEFKDFEDWFESIATTFCMTFGRYGVVTTKDHAKHPGISIILMVLFAILIPILLLNMLIAMMAKTYTEIMARAVMEWKRQWAMIVLQAERTVDPQQLVRYQKAYSASITFDHPQAVSTETTHTNFSKSLAPPTLLTVGAELPGSIDIRERRRSWVTLAREQQQIDMMEEGQSLLRRGQDDWIPMAGKTGKGVSCRAVLIEKLVNLKSEAD
ncbi:transient receptor potential cation channel subfamily V member 6-like [Lytechinus pictus]|uniref:transient receptor potential cation channel subfamily V member 6-like n=1 Tax=Lytechinus pictus TaxID=7653 RepID=UPI0030B9FA97